MLKKPINRESFEIETERLLLVPIDLKYDQDIFREFNEEIAQYMTPVAARDISETHTFITVSLEKHEKQTDMYLIILKKDTKEFIGCIGLHKVNTNIPEFWIRTKKSSHGNKYGYEAVLWVYKRAQDNIEAECIIYPVDHRNIASCKIPERLWWVTDWIIEIEETYDLKRKLEIIKYKILL